jgi:hypothetical protein
MPKKAEEPQVDERGQLLVKLDGQQYVLRPSLEAILAVERHCHPRRLYDLAQEASRAALPLEDMGYMVAQFMQAHGKAYPQDPHAHDYQGAKPERCTELIYEAGAPSVCARLYILLLGAISGGYDAKGEVRAPTGKTTETPAGA